MTSEFTGWVKEKAELIESKTQYYTNNERTIIKVRFLKKLVEEVMPTLADIQTMELLKEEIDNVIAAIPLKNEVLAKIKYGDYLIKVRNLKKTVKDKLNLVEEGQYRALGISFGLVFGTSMGPVIGVLIGNIALGIGIGLPLGMALGVIIGVSYEARAKKQNRII